MEKKDLVIGKEYIFSDNLTLIEGFYDIGTLIHIKEKESDYPYVYLDGDNNSNECKFIKQIPEKSESRFIETYAKWDEEAEGYTTIRPNTDYTIFLSDAIDHGAVGFKFKEVDGIYSSQILYKLKDDIHSLFKLEDEDNDEIFFANKVVWLNPKYKK